VVRVYKEYKDLVEILVHKVHREVSVYREQLEHKVQEVQKEI
jgi:hypothetical protein